MLRPRLRYLILFLSLGLVASYVSVNVLTSYSYLPSGIAITNYGFPLLWETVSGTVCGQSPSQPQGAYSVLNRPCLSSCCVTTYNFAFLLFDMLFYMGIGYLSLLSYHRLFARSRQASFRTGRQPTVRVPRVYKGRRQGPKSGIVRLA